jgi:predicted PurR-regulated permease PerM
MGFIIGIGASLVAAMLQFNDPYYLVLVVVVFGAGQLLEGMLLTPLLVGDKIGLHPVAVIFAIMAGGQLFGFTGVLLALPAAAVIMVLLRHLHQGYRGSDLYHARQVAPVIEDDGGVDSTGKPPQSNG